MNRENKIKSTVNNLDTRLLICTTVPLTYPKYYELKSLGLDNRTTLVLSNIRKLFYKLVYLTLDSSTDDP